MSQSVSGTFISEKANKIRWQPSQFSSQTFLTGSWDNDENHIRLWTYHINEDDPDVYPFELQNYKFQGDVTELKFLNRDKFVASSSNGDVKLLNVSHLKSGRTEFTVDIDWKGIHKFDIDEPASCTGLAIYDEDVVTVGEDGRINLLTARQSGIVRTIDNADSSSLQCIVFLKHSEILTGNSRGQMKIWDLRDPSNAPIQSFMLSSDQLAATSLTHHPTQRHVVVAGDEEGSLTVWDLRHNTFPVNLLSAHGGAVTELQFHPDYPDQLFSSSVSGDLWHWNSANKNNALIASLDASLASPWLNTEVAKNKLEIFSLLPQLHKPISCLDVNENKVLCGCDNEAVYLINDIVLL